MWGNLETFKQNPVKDFNRNRNAGYEKSLKIFLSKFWDPHMQLEKLGSTNKRVFEIHSLHHPIKRDVASRAESKKTQ